MDKKKLSVFISRPKGSDLYRAHFYRNGRVVQVVASPNDRLLKNMRRRFYRGTLRFAKPHKETGQAYHYDMLVVK